MSSIFASYTHKTIQVPDDAPQTVTIRKLTGREVELAQAENRQDVIAGRGWATRLQQRLNKATTDAEAAAVLNDPLNGYDRLTMCRAGIISWTYDQKLTPVSVSDIDDERLEHFATEILKLTKPHLFQTTEQQEESRKNG